MERIKAIVFDCGDVISSNPSYYIYKLISRKFKIDYGKIKKEVSNFVQRLQKNQISEKNFWEKLANRLGIKNSGELRKFWIEKYEENAKINKKVLSLVRKLKKMRFKLCLLSNTVKFHKRASFRRLLKKEFPLVIYSCDVKMRKPEKRIYLLTLKKLKLNPEDCLIIDNEERNLNYPKKIGMETIQFKSLKQLRKDLKSVLDLPNL